MTIPIPDTHPNVPWKVPHKGKVVFEFNENVDNFEVDHPGYFDPTVQPGRRNKGDTIKCTAIASEKTVAFTYSPDNSTASPGISPALVDSHTILIGN